MYKHSEIQSLAAAGLRPTVSRGVVTTRVAPPANFQPQRKPSIAEQLVELDAARRSIEARVTEVEKGRRP